MPINEACRIAARTTQFKKDDPRLTKGKDKLLSGDAGKKLRVTVGQFEELLKVGGGHCEICGKLPKKHRLAVDHDHKTGKVRGLLCFRCNYGMSWFQDDPLRLHRAGTYLERAG